MVDYQRQGECSWCGQCCGALHTYGGAVSNPQPWPQNFTQDRITWNDASWAQYVVFSNYIDRLELESGSGFVRIGPTRYYWKMSPDGTFVKTDSTYTQDFGRNGKQCPFLVILRDDSTPSTPADPCTECAVYGSQVWTMRCGLLPPDTMSYEQMQEWQTSHPACAYTWVEIP